MRNLQKFMRFDFEAFSRGKEYTVTGCSEWTDYATKEHIGTKVEVAVTKDETDYNLKNGNGMTNLMEKFVFKVTKDVTVAMNAKVHPVNPKATAYGIDRNGNFCSYLNCLSVTCDDITVL